MERTAAGREKAKDVTRMGGSGEIAEFGASLFEWISETLSLESGFLGKLARDDDWTLIIKLHAIIEAGLTNALVTQFDAPELDRVLAKLDTSNAATGKIAFAHALGIISKASFVFIQDLSKLRNHCVHNPRNFSFNLGVHLSSLPEKERNAFITHVANALKVPGCIERIEQPSRQALMDAPSFGITWATLLVMAQLSIHAQQCKVRSLEAELARRMAARLDAQNQATPK